MRRHRAACLLLPVLVGLSACESAPPPPPEPPPPLAAAAPPPFAASSTTTVVTQLPPPPSAPPPGLAPSLAMVSPQAPPPAPAELVPPPPSDRPVTWLPGHWRWTGNQGAEWQWEPGRYVARPAGRSGWAVGQWQPASNGWIWIEGHWQ